MVAVLIEYEILQIRQTNQFLILQIGLLAHSYQLYSITDVGKVNTIRPLLTDMKSTISQYCCIFHSQQVQYAFCHEVLAAFMDKFENYANFTDVI